MVLSILGRDVIKKFQLFLYVFTKRGIVVNGDLCLLQKETSRPYHVKNTRLISKPLTLKQLHSSKECQLMIDRSLDASENS